MPVTKEEFEAWWERNLRLGQNSTFGRGLKGWAWASVDHFCNGVELEPYELGRRTRDAAAAADAVSVPAGRSPSGSVAQVPSKGA